jgi:hypothetical protein
LVQPRNNSVSNLSKTSDNFVRRNLKKQFGGFKQKVRTNRSKETLLLSSNPLDNSNQNEKLEYSINQSSNQGLVSTGVDSLEAALDYLTPKNEAIQDIRWTQLLKHPTTSVKYIEDIVKPRGLVDPMSQRKLKIHSRAMKRARRLYGGLDDDALQDMAPLCPGHNTPAKLLIVRKTGENKVLFRLNIFFNE